MNTPNPVAARDLAAPETELVEAELVEDFSDDDITASPRVEQRTITLATGQKRHVYVKRLSGAEAIALLRDAAKNATNDVNSVPVMKLKRCLVKSIDDHSARFNDVTALKVIKDGDANQLAALLGAVHSVNPLVKNA